MTSSWTALLVGIVGISSFGATSAWSQTGPRYGEALFERIAGAPLSARRPDYASWAALIQRQDWATLAARATEEATFTDTTVVQWANLYYTAGRSAALPLDDALAALIGVARDNLDARLLVRGDFSYVPDARFGVEPRIDGNASYELVSQRQTSLKTALSYRDFQWDIPGYDHAAGLMTTRSWAALHYSGGTNRRAARAAFETFLCRPNPTWMVPNLPAERIRRDVDRAPGGDPRVFQQDCRTCHTTLDPISNAFAHLDFVGASFVVANGIRPKYLQNPMVYPEGYVPTDDTWINELARSPTNTARSFGWRGETSGTGVTELGAALAASQAFSGCLAKRVFASVCLEDREMTDPVIRQLAEEFESQDGYKLRNLFARAALRPECIPQSNPSIMMKRQERFARERKKAIKRYTPGRVCPSPHRNLGSESSGG